MKKSGLTITAIIVALVYSLSALAADPIAFGPADSYVVPTAPFRMATGDFNKDGYADVAVAHDNTNYSILMNNGDGTFTKSGGTITGARLRDVAVVTLAGDTIQDLVFSDWTVTNLRVLTGNGLGGFTGPTNYATGGAADGIVAGDFNKDGYVDVAIAKRSASQVGVLLGKAGGGFDAVVNYGAGGAVMELAAGLVNGDTILDLVTANYTSDNIGILIGNGAGGFGSVTTIAAGNDNTDVALGDLNGDGLLDAVVTNEGADGVVIISGDGLGGFTLMKSIPTGNNPHQVRLADLNGNGRLDIATANRGAAPGLSVVLSHGYGHFTSAFQFHSDRAANGLVIADFNPASLPDIATAHPTVNVARVIPGTAVDTDADLLADADEAYYFTNTSNADSDGDLMPDGLEVKYWCLRPAVNNGAVDSDGDGPSNLAEYLVGTDPCDSLADTDGDGMDDAWENAHACLDAGVADGTGDFDFDTVTNLREYRLNSDPCNAADTDGDGMPDGWEDLYACVDSLVGDSTLDPDADTVNNLAEYLGGTDPCVQNDTDGDGMPDVWENAYGCMQPGTPDAGMDYDFDFLPSLAEYQGSTDPCVFNDADGDGMPDGWEDLYACVDRLTGDSTLDPDADTVNNLAEYLGSTDPCVQNDTDGDGIPDVWENAYGCMLPGTADAGSDYDSDYLTNLQEYQFGTDPCGWTDTDGDLMPDGWEEGYTCVDRLTGDSALDPDNDLVSNLMEYQEGLNPCDNDTDNDQMTDGWELLHACVSAGTADGGGDPDADLLTNLQEFQFGTDPCGWSDTDGDLMPDGWEEDYACVDRLTGDSTLDPDGDYQTNLEEYQAGQNPCVFTDTDGDGLGDGVETNTGVYVDETDTGTDPANPDSDADGVSDGVEMARGSHPLNAAITPGLIKQGDDHLVMDPAADGVNPYLAWSGSEYGLAWQDARAGAGQEEIYFRRVSVDGDTIGPEARITDAAGASKKPVVAWGGSEFGVSYNDNRAGMPSVYFSRVSALGAKVGSDTLIFSNLTVPSPALGYSQVWSGSEWGITWDTAGIYHGDSSDIYFARLSAAGSKIGGNVRVWDESPGDWSGEPSIAWTGSEYGIASRGDSGTGSVYIIFNRLSATGAKLQFLGIAGGSNQSPPVSWVYYSMAWTGSEFGVMVDFYDGLNLYRRTPTGDGVAGYTPQLVFPLASSTRPSLTWSGSEYGIIFNNKLGEIGAGGSKIGNEIQVSAVNLSSIASSGSDYAVTWASAGDIYVAIYGIDYDGDGLTDREELAAGTDAADWDSDDDGLPDGDEVNNYGTDPNQADSDGDGLDDGTEVSTYFTAPDDWDSDGDHLPDGFEATNLSGHTAGKDLDPLDPADGTMSFDHDAMPNVHEYWNGSDLWNDDPRPEPGYDVGCYFWGKGDGGPYVQPSDINQIQMAYVGAPVDYSQVLPPAFDPLDLDRSTVPDPADITLAQYMYIEADRPGGYVSSPASLSLEYSPSAAIAVGDTTHVTVSVHAQGPGTELYSPGFGVVFWVTSGNAVLLGGEGTDPGEAVGNRYDVSMEAASGALANIVVLVTGPGPVVVNAKAPGCGVEPVGRWCAEVVLPTAIVINP